MGFLMPKQPKPTIVTQEVKPPPTVDTARAAVDANDTAARDAARRRSTIDTNLTQTARRRGGLSEAYREKVGG